MHMKFLKASLIGIALLVVSPTALAFNEEDVDIIRISTQMPKGSAHTLMKNIVGEVNGFQKAVSNIGSSNYPYKEKDALINELISKIFKDENVKIEISDLWAPKRTETIKTYLNNLKETSYEHDFSELFFEPANNRITNFRVTKPSDNTIRYTIEIETRQFYNHECKKHGEYGDVTVKNVVFFFEKKLNVSGHKFYITKITAHDTRMYTITEKEKAKKDFYEENKIVP